MLTGLEAYAADPQGNFDVKVLKGKLGDMKRIRVGKYRILFDDENAVVSVCRRRSTRPHF
jgi:mRNA-degrading endonuclease RelE of RelBE toxin-antitoxin system